MMTLSWNIGLWKKFGGWGCHGNRKSYLVILQPTRMSWQFIFNNNFRVCCTASLSSVSFYIFIFFSETSGPIGTSRNVHWMVPYKVYDFLLIRSTQKKQEAQRCLKGCIHINEYISEKNNSGSVKSIQNKRFPFDIHLLCIVHIITKYKFSFMLTMMELCPL